MRSCFNFLVELGPNETSSASLQSLKSDAMKRSLV